MELKEKIGKKTLGSRLKALLFLRGCTARDFSAATGIQYRILQDYKNDKVRPGADQLARMAGAGVDVSYILTGRFSLPSDLPTYEGIFAEDGEKQDDIVLTETPPIADHTLFEELQDNAFRLVEWYDNVMRPTEDKLSLKSSVILYNYILSVYVRQVDYLAPSITDMRKRKLPHEDIAQWICNAAHQETLFVLTVKGDKL